MKFYKCPICGNVITLIDGNEKLIKCCGVNMEELTPNVVDASVEKHVPVFNVNGEFIEVRVGEVEHPMTEEHYIMFLAQVIDNDVHIVKFNYNDVVVGQFKNVSGSKIYSYCNLHGLWMTDVK